ncbi:MAG: biotin synthase [Rubrivivax sp.]|nr:biotin synthase [Rubrivivax sp.]
MISPERSTRRPLDAVALARVTRRLLRADAPPWLHGEVARCMAERLPVIRMQPERVCDWGAFIGASHARLAQAYPAARLIAVEADPARRDATATALAPPWWSPRRWASSASRAPVALAVDELGAGQCQLLWANMSLHGALDPGALMRQWHRALEVDGFLMFSTLGPGSLQALRDLYARAGWPAPMAPLVDMHDLGDMLVEAGFAEPVMDQETLTLTWPSADALLAELRSLGGNVDPGRAAGLRTPRWRSALLGLLAARADASGRIALGFEIVYGHAFRPPPRPRAAAETVLALDDMRALVRVHPRRV